MLWRHGTVENMFLDQEMRIVSEVDVRGSALGGDPQ
jgi:hypothetical protein